MRIVELQELLNPLENLNAKNTFAKVASPYFTANDFDFAYARA